MTVLHLLGSPYEGGAETYFMDLVEALRDEGVSQAAAIHANPGREQGLRTLGVPMETMPFAAPFDLVTGAKIRAFAKRLDARILLQWMNRAGRVAPQKGPWVRIGRLGGYYHLKYYRGCDHLVGNTQDIVDYIRRKGWPADRVEYIPNFAEADPHAAADRAALDTPEDAPLLLGMGRLHDDKAHDVSIRALPALPGAILWIAGDGPREKDLKAQARRLGVADRVRFLGWRADAAALYRAADVCLFPSRFEPLGNTVIQAWAHACPLVAAASQGPGALVRHEVDGLLVPVEDADALAAATLRMLSEPDLRRRLVAGGRRRVEGEFSKAAVVAQWRALFARFGEG
jgi:glycosyltransferase involved in cell wall biosynthesis